MTRNGAIEQPPAGSRASSKAPEFTLGVDAVATAPDDASLSSGQPEVDPLAGAPRQAWVEWYGEDVIEEAEHTFGISFDEEPDA